MKVSVKKISDDAVIPSYAKPGDAGLDLTATEVSMDINGNLVYSTGLAFGIPEGYVGLLFPRSSVCKKKLSLANSVGVIDSGYRGEVKVVFRTGVSEYGILQPDTVYKAGERVAQLIILPLPYITLVEEKELPETERGMGGFGSSGL